MKFLGIIVLGLFIFLARKEMMVLEHTRIADLTADDILKLLLYFALVFVLGYNIFILFIK